MGGSSPSEVALPLAAIDAYVRELQLGCDDSASTQSLTVENILTKIYDRFFTQRGQLPLPNGIPFALKEIPALAAVALRQSRITAMVQSAVATRPVVTVHELEYEVCLSEGVSAYMELGLGRSLSKLPFVQHMFNVTTVADIAPVTSADFTQFLLFDNHASSLVAGGADANDAVLAFSRRYKKGRYKASQLGIHIQDFTRLMHFVRQEVRRVDALFSQIQVASTDVFQRNRVFYERVIRSLHATVMLQQVDADPSLHAVEFVVHATYAEAQVTNIPLSLWGLSNGPSGGLSLYGSLRAHPASSRTMGEEVAPTIDAFSSSTAAASPSFSVDVKAITSHSFASKRRRRTVVDEEASVLDVDTTSSFPSKRRHLEEPQLQALNRFSEAPVASPSLRSLQIPIEKAASILRCLAIIQAGCEALRPAWSDDFTIFATYASELLPLLRQEEKLEGSAYNIKGSGSSFMLDVNTLLSVLSSHKGVEFLYKYYCSITHNQVTKSPCIRSSNSCSVKNKGENPSTGLFLLHCLQSEMSNLVFLPLMKTNFLLPLSAVRNVFRGRVLFSGSLVSTGFLAFHPLHLVFRPLTSSGTCGSVAFINGTVLLCGLFEFNIGSFHLRRQHGGLKLLLEALEGYGVLTQVPKQWFLDGFLLRLLEGELLPCIKTVERESLEECRLAVCMLLLYWWLFGLWCESPSSETAQAVESFLQKTHNMPWIPCLSRSSNNTSLYVKSWQSPLTLFPTLECFTSYGLSKILCFAPHDISDLVALVKQDAAYKHAKDELFFLDVWISTLRPCVATNFMGALPRLLGVPMTCTPAVALRVLRTLPIGGHFSLCALRYFLHCIAGATRLDILDARQQSFFPLPSSRVSIATDDEFVVAELAPCETLCWNALHQHDDLGVWDRSIHFVGEDLQHFLVDVLGVSLVPSVMTWFAGAKACGRCIVAGEGVDTQLTDQCLHVLEYSCVAYYEHLVETLKKQPDGLESAGEEALACILRQLPTEARTDYFFPLDGRWRCPTEGLFFCGPYYCDLSGCALKAPEGLSAPKIPLLVFMQQPHFVVTFVLREMGLFALEECTEKNVTFGCINTAMSSEFHKRVNECVQYVEPFLLTHHPAYYYLVRKEVSQNLEQLSTVMALEPELREVLRYHGHVYTMKRTLTCHYVRSHNCLYGFEEECLPSLAVEAIAEVCVPFMDARVRQDVVKALHFLFQDAGLHIKGALPSPTSSLEIAERTWQLSAAPSPRFRENFPTSCDGFGPTGHNAATASRGRANTSRMLFLPWSNGGYMARSLPQWQCDLFYSAHEWLRERECAHDDESECDTSRHVKKRSARHNRRGGRTKPQNIAPMHLLGRRETVEYAVAAERFVAEKLRSEVPQNVEVLWVNEHGESGAPYDILLLRRPSIRGASQTSLSAGEIVAYIEVKSTCTNTRRDFELSLRELLFAARFGKAYKIYRVFRASTSATQRMHVEVLEDLIKSWYTGELSITGEVKVMLTPE